jgi:hypothetical protein
MIDEPLANDSVLWQARGKEQEMMKTRLSRAVLVGALAVLASCRCQEGTEVTIETIQADAAAAPQVVGPDENIAACREATSTLAVMIPDERAAFVRTKCSPLFVEASCRQAVSELGESPTKGAVLAAADQCAKAYCPSLDAPRPPLCGAKLDEGSLSTSFYDEWARFGGEAIIRDHQAPLSWARSVAGMMCTDWGLPPDPAFTQPDGRSRPADLVASIRPVDGSTTVMEIRPAAGGEPLKTWRFTNDPRTNDIERMIDGDEALLRGKAIRIEPERGGDSLSFVRASTSLSAVGAHITYDLSSTGRPGADVPDGGATARDGGAAPAPAEPTDNEGGE